MEVPEIEVVEVADRGLDERPGAAAPFRADRGPAGRVLVVLAVVALAAGALLLRPADGDSDAAVDEQTTTTAATDPEPDGAGAPDPVPLGAAGVDPPSIALSRYEGIADGAVVGAQVTGLVPGSHVLVQQCTEDHVRCTPVAEASADSDGSFEGGFRLWRDFGSHREQGARRSANVDCVLERCVLRVEAEAPGGRRVPPAAIRFDPGRGARVPPTARLAGEGPFSPGDTVDLHVDGMPEGVYVDASICPLDRRVGGPTVAGCIGHSGAEYGGGDTIRLRVLIDAATGSDPCGGGCALFLSVHRQGPAGGVGDAPPPLFPEPIPLPITP